MTGSPADATAPAPSPTRLVAGVDLGSNSFHMLVARAEEDGRVHVLDRLRAPVRLAAGLDANDELTTKAVRRAFRALERFGERVREMPRFSVRAVGTNTLRRARNGQEFAEAAADALGHPIEIISGYEEARLIYLGVSHATPNVRGRHLVIDVGGGSTECIIGEGHEPLALDSLYMGCVGYTQEFFARGRLTRAAFRRARVAAALEFSSIGERYRRLGWERATGSSGTVLAVQAVLRANGWADEAITRAGLAALQDELVRQKRLDALELAGLEAERAAVFPGGVAILAAAFEALGLESLGASASALREGLVYELLGRATRHDARDDTVETFATRYKVDLEQAERVRCTAVALFEAANASWGLDAESGTRLVGWAARLHEIGLSIAYSGHHKHGAYILAHADMPGFSLDEQETLAAIVGAHRRKLTLRPFDELPDAQRELAFRVALALRLAVRLHHSRSAEPLPELWVRADESRLALEFPPGWLEARPLTRADLREEASCLKRVGIALRAVSRLPGQEMGESEA